MKLVELKGITFVEGGVCAAKGFRANGVQCGLAHKPLGDMAEANAAANNNNNQKCCQLSIHDI